MKELEKKIAAVRFRLKLFRALDWALWALVGGLTAVFVFLLALKLFPNSIPRIEISLAIVGGALVVALVAAFARRLSMVDAAVQTDGKLQLRERLSSALILSRMGRTDQTAYAALEADAVRYAKSIQPSRDFRYRMPGHAKHTIWPALAIVAIYFMPQMDLFSKPAPPPRKPVATAPQLSAEEKREAAERIRELAEKARATEEELEATDEELELAEKLERLSQDLSLGKKNEREVVAEMSRLSDELKMREREMARKTQPFKQIKCLERNDMTNDLRKDLKDQNFQGAAQKMMDLAQKMADPNAMSPEELEQLSKELQELSDSLQDNQQMSEALQQASQAAQQMAQAQRQQNQQNQSSQNSQNQQANNQQNQGGNQQQSGQSQQNQPQQNQANQGNSDNSQNQSGSQQQQAAQAASNAMQNAAQQMQEMQQMMAQSQRVSELQNSMSECMGQCMGAGNKMAQSQGSRPGQQASGSQPGSNPGAQPGANSGSGQGSPRPGNRPGNLAGTGEWREGMSQNASMGTGGPGQGMGGNPPDDGSTASFEDVFVPGQQNEGEIIAFFEIEASAPRGESNMKYTKVPQAYRQQAADAIVDQEIPAGMRNQVRDYFEAINFETQNAEEE